MLDVLLLDMDTEVPDLPEKKKIKLFSQISGFSGGGWNSSQRSGNMEDCNAKCAWAQTWTPPRCIEKLSSATGGRRLVSVKTGGFMCWLKKLFLKVTYLSIQQHLGQSGGGRFQVGPWKSILEQVSRKNYMTG